MLRAGPDSRLEPGTPARRACGPIEGVPSWRVNLAFFGVVPEQEQGLQLFANDVVDETRLDCGDVALDADLTGVTRLPASNC